MQPPGKYTCTDYRQEMILLGLRRQLANPTLTQAERQRISRKIRELEAQMGLD